MTLQAEYAGTVPWIQGDLKFSLNRIGVLASQIFTNQHRPGRRVQRGEMHDTFWDLDVFPVAAGGRQTPAKLVIHDLPTIEIPAMMLRLDEAPLFQ